MHDLSSESLPADLADQAERRGRAVGPTISAFRAAVADRGHDGMAEALISRHNQRMMRIVQESEIVQRSALVVLQDHFRLHACTLLIGADRKRRPGDPGGTWIDHLGWGLDSVTATVRMLLAMQPVGAALLARSQLERWSSNLAYNDEVPQMTGEDTASYLTRLWTRPGVGLTPRSSTVGTVYSVLSEILHGRGLLMPLVWLDAVDVSTAPLPDHIRLIDMVTDALVVSNAQLRTCLAAAYEDAFGDGGRGVLQGPLIRPAESWAQSTFPLVVPLLPHSFETLAPPLRAMASTYENTQAELLVGNQPKPPREVWPLLAFGDQRYRALHAAQQSYLAEKTLFADRFNPHGIEELSTEETLSGEMAAMLGRWLRGMPGRSCAADALVTTASALRSAFWLWLEDDDRAMGCLRVVVEQLARARTWRNKPAKAAKIEANANATPRDWIEASGWKRLTILNKALGEMAHGSSEAQWDSARAVLVGLQPNPDDGLAQQTGRTHTLRALIYIVAVECSAWLDVLAPDLGDAYRKITRISDEEGTATIEDFMNRAWAARSMPVRK